MFLKSQPVQRRVRALEKGQEGKQDKICFPVQNETALSVLRAMPTLLSTKEACDSLAYF